MRDSVKLKQTIDCDAVLKKLVELFIEDPTDKKAAQFVLTLFEENGEYAELIRALYTEAIYRVYFQVDEY